MTEHLMNIIPLIATVFMTICYLPQLIQTYRTKDVSGISLSFFALLNVALTLLLINSILLYTVNGNFGYVVSYIFNEGFALIMLIMIIKYRRKTPREIKHPIAPIYSYKK